MMRGLKLQPNAEHCRHRLEKLLEDDSRIKNAKARLSDKGRRIREDKEQEEGEGEGSDDKRRRLQEMEERAMVEEDPEKLNKLFEDYRVEYQKVQAEEDQAKDKNRRKLEEIEDELMGTQNAKRTAELYQEYMEERKRTKREGQMQEKATGSRDPASYTEPEVMHIDQVMREEWSDQEKKWDDDVKDY